MKKILLSTVSLLGLLALLYVGGLYYVDSRLQAELNSFELAFASSNEILVYRFDYERGLWPLYDLSRTELSYNTCQP